MTTAYPSIEPLESRIAPAATFVNATTATYTDTDGDLVTVAFSKGILTNTNFDEVLVVAASGPLGGDQLRTIDLTIGTVATSPAGTSITIKAKPNATMGAGDGLANVGHIKANGFDLGAVKVPGDLGRVVAGDPMSLATPGLASLSVSSMGRFGITTGSPDLLTNVQGKLGSVTVIGDLLGERLTATAFGKITNVRGGSGADSGEILSTGDMGTVTIGGDLIGAGTSSGMIFSGAKLGNMKVAGSVIGGFGNSSGQIFSVGDMGTVKILGDLRGGDVNAGGSDSSGYIQGASIKSVFVGGSVVAGRDDSDTGSLVRNGSIRAVNDIGSITILGSLAGTAHTDAQAGDGDFTIAIITARGKASMPASGDVALGKMIIGGRVERAEILAGYDPAGAPKNADAQIGKVTVGGDWISSNLLAGVQDAGDGFGNSSDVKITGGKDNADNGGAGAISKIASVIIKGNALGTAASGDFLTFGIEAQQLGSIKVGHATVPLLPGAGNDVMLPGNLANKARPLGASFGTTISDGFDFHAFEVAVAT